MKKILLGTVIVLAVLAAVMPWTAYAEATEAGVAAAVKGEVKATTPPDTAARALQSGDKVFMGDKIETGTDGQLQILLLDQTVFTLGASSAVTVDEFVYDPTTDDGKVKASMAKGIFRVVSGKIAHKKPENMTVDLPAGSIGFRGTNVAGIIDGAKTTVVLLGPVGVGRIYVTNVVNGEVVAVDIDEAGFATIVDGPNSAPVPVFQVSEADLNLIAGALGQQTSGGGSSESGAIDETSGPGPIGGQTGSVDTQDLLNALNTIDDLNQTSTAGAQDAAASSAAAAHDAANSGGSEDQGGSGNNQINNNSPY